MKGDKSIVLFLSLRAQHGNSILRMGSFRRYLEKVVERKFATSPLSSLGYPTSTGSVSTFFIAVNADRTKIASTHGDHSVKIFRCFDGTLLHTLTGHPRSPWCVDFHPTNPDLLASGCLGGQVRVWDLRAIRNVLCNHVWGSVVASLAFHPDMDVLLVASGNKIHFWDWKEGHMLHELETRLPQESIRVIRFHPNGKWLMTAILNGGERSQYEPTFVEVSTLNNQETGQQMVQSVSCVRMNSSHQNSASTISLGREEARARVAESSSLNSCRSATTSTPMTQRAPIREPSSFDRLSIPTVTSTHNTDRTSSITHFASQETSPVRTVLPVTSGGPSALDLSPGLERSAQANETGNSSTAVPRDSPLASVDIPSGVRRRRSSGVQVEESRRNVELSANLNSELLNLTDLTRLSATPSAEPPLSSSPDGNSLRRQSVDPSPDSPSTGNRHRSRRSTSRRSSDIGRRYRRFDIHTNQRSYQTPEFSVSGTVNVLPSVNIRYPSVSDYSASVYTLDEDLSPAVATATAQTSYHVHTAVVVATRDDVNPNQALETAINRALAGAFVGIGEAAVASNIINTTYRIQLWETDALANIKYLDEVSRVVVSRGKIYNDGSVDISQDGQYLAAFVAGDGGFPSNGYISLFSLSPKTFGQCILKKVYGPNAVSVSISPANQFLLVGMASKRHGSHRRNHQLMADVIDIADERTGIDRPKPARVINHDMSSQPQSRVSTNVAMFHPTPGCGVLYGTNTGLVQHCTIRGEDPLLHLASARQLFI